MFNIGNVLVHKSLGNQPLVVQRITVDPLGNIALVHVRYGTQGTEGGVYFTEFAFLPEELETPLESMSREAEIFKALNAKKEEINAYLSNKPAGISHLN